MYLLLILCAVIVWVLYISTRPQKKIPAKGIVVITGASSGLGRETAIYLYEKGYTVIAGVRTEKDGIEIVAETKQTHGGALHYLILDVTNQDQIDKAFEFVAGMCGEEGLFCLVNNAGVVGQIGPVEFLDIQQWKDTFDVNFFGHIRMIQKFLPLLRNHRHARVINNSSPAAVVSIPLMGQYCSSKAALSMVNGNIRQELYEQNITSILLLPAALKSRMVDNVVTSFEKYIDQHAGNLPNYSKVINVVHKFIKSTHTNKAVLPAALASETIYTILTTEKPNYKYTVGNAPPGFFAALPPFLQDWVLTKL